MENNRAAYINKMTKNSKMHKYFVFIEKVMKKIYIFFSYNKFLRKLQKYAISSSEYSVKKYDEIFKRKLDKYQNENKSTILCEKSNINISFVLLQYNRFDVTQEAIESISKLSSPCTINIIVVDNGSTDNSKEKLAEYAEKNKNIHPIFIKENVGFAKGNNTGYNYAKKELNSDFIVIANNDVIYLQNNTIDIIINKFMREPYSILGPDIIVQKDRIYHQNPMRKRIKTKYEAVQFLIERNNRLKELNVNTTKILPNPSIMGKEKYIQKDLSGPIVLHGSIYILSPIFIKDMEKVFYEKTFLYGEEEIFTLLSYAKGHKIVYTPEIKVLHKVKMSTDISNLQNYYKKSYSYIIDSTNIYLELLDSMGL